MLLVSHSKVDLVIAVVTIVVLLALSALLLSGRGSFLIAGYNTSSKEEKEKYDEKALCRFMGKFLLFIAVLSMLIVIGSYIGSNVLVWVAAAGVLISVVAVVIYANTGGRFLR